MRKAFRKACTAVEQRRKVNLVGIRPYDLRHSFASQVYAATGDIRATQELLGHSTPALTARYTLGAVDARLQAAITALGKGVHIPESEQGGESSRKVASGSFQRKKRP